LVSTSDETLRDYFAQLNLEGERKVWAKNRTKINYVYRRIKKLLNKGDYICEVGVGEGYLLRLLRRQGFKVLGVDLSKYLVNELKDRFDHEGLDIELIHADISKVDLGKDRFNSFFCFDVLEHVPDIKAAIKTIKKSLITGGLLIATLPFRENLDENMAICPHCKFKFHIMGHSHSFRSFQEVKRLLGAEFEIIEWGEIPIVQSKTDAVASVIRKIINIAIPLRKNSSTIYLVGRLVKQP
jgi:2-polyprenyl-3-methyl-5-hydroxy-6-metoxy-1,4-benzoquinol methylase